MELVIMAGGMGSRFGGLKQIEPIDDNGNFIIDYSIYDAIKVGFDKIVFIIKEENLKDFKSTIGKRIEDKIKVEYVFQGPNSFVPEEYKGKVSRTKPWGTAHAVLCSKLAVNDKFAIINADDFYGRGSLQSIYNFLKNNKNENDFGMVGFKIINTLTENGAVKRGVCRIENGNLLGLTESSIVEENGKVVATSLLDNSVFDMSADELVSMNLFGFSKNLFEFLEEGFKKFLQKNKDDLTTCEYFIPTILTEYVNCKKGNLKVVSTDEKWYGLTYKKDYQVVCDGIKRLINKGVYPKNLWEN